ncbi:MAG: hypothetical protein IPK19_20920 [Chloroflexi bacterium]|nr:hypothetical protein [Chloroflexota bacterium]
MKTSRLAVLVTTLALSLLAAGSAAAFAVGLPLSAGATRADWEARLPLLAVVILFVLFVDALFAIPALRKLSQTRRTTAGRSAGR